MRPARLPSRGTAGAVLAVIGAIFIGYVGISYLLTPASMAPAFGLPSRPRAEGAGFLAVKGIRDVVSGLVILTVLLAGNRRVLGWVVLVTALTPLGDMILVLGSGGAAATAFGVHGATAAAVVLAGGLLLSGARPRPATPAP
ncbi:DUF4267 domain-containing protein [Actinomadura sp. ATCC 31491]|uniref:DUF4267 domain-containing protein n=1 Tax=Actinomadura luzonensis TaxID=2805427 RepID=A0ABT0FN64_9ACTN|nr:DUF4267 domain-containing protein [Actinomadura luzonensis]MCK2213726.1 DUF4267 domain-containing protein [Actinomadura luzonensis]